MLLKTWRRKQKQKREKKQRQQRRQQCQRCQYILLCEGNDGNKLTVLQYIIGRKREPDTACGMRERVEKNPPFPGQTWEELGRKIGEYVDEGFTRPCHQCGKPVEKIREHYVLPTCYACLPPPKPLKVISA